MPDKLTEMLKLVWSVLVSFKDTDFGQVGLDSLDLALGTGFFLLAVFLYKILWGKNKFRYYYSGHKIPAEYDESATLYRRLIYALPKFLLIVSAVFMLMALANPYLPRTKIETIVESRERAELIDSSPSMGWPFGNTGKSACEIIREVHLKFLKMRRGQNDRVTLWLFSKNAYKAEDFIIDDGVYTMQVEDAPCVMVSQWHLSLPKNDPDDRYLDIVAPRDMIRIMEKEGVTNLVGGLQAVIQYFDREGKKNIKRKSLLLITDAAVDADPEKELQELKKRHIIPYVVHIKPNEIGEKQFDASFKISLAQLLKQKIKQYGGKVFDVEDRASAERAYAEINRLETAPVSIIRHSLRVPIFQRPLMVAMVLVLLSIFSGILIELFFGEYP